MPYGESKLVFASSYYGFDMLKEENFWHLLKDTRKLVFLPSPFINEVVDCLTAGQGVAHATIAFTTYRLLVFDREEFYDSIVRPEGKSHSCMKSQLQNYFK